MKVSRASRIALAATALLAGTAFAQVKVGITVSATGPAASLGIPEKNTVARPRRRVQDGGDATWGPPGCEEKGAFILNHAASGCGGARSGA